MHRLLLLFLEAIASSTVLQIDSHAGQILQSALLCELPAAVLELLAAGIVAEARANSVYADKGYKPLTQALQGLTCELAQPNAMLLQ